MIAVGSGHNGSLKTIQKLYAIGYATKDDYAKALRAYQAYLSEIKRVIRGTMCSVIRLQVLWMIECYSRVSFLRGYITKQPAQKWIFWFVWWHIITMKGVCTASSEFLDFMIVQVGSKDSTKKLYLCTSFIHRHDHFDWAFIWYISPMHTYLTQPPATAYLLSERFDRVRDAGALRSGNCECELREVE